MIRQLAQLTRNHTCGPVLPLELILYVTKRCPLRCAHCFIEEFDTDASRDLPLDAVRRLADDLPNLLVLMITGGEPILRSDLPEVVRSFCLRCRPVAMSLITSGWFPEKTAEVVQRILRIPEMRSQLVVTLSFDGTREGHDIVRRRKGSYNRALDAAGRLREIADGDDRLVVAANLTLVPQNQNTILDAARGLAETGLFTVLTHNMYRENKPRHAFTGNDAAVYRDLSDFVHEYSRRFDAIGGRALGLLHRVKERKQSRLIAETCRTNEYQGLPCEAGRNIGVVYSDGSVAACELLPASWGNIKHRSFAEIWNDVSNRRCSNQIRSTKCFCTHECFIGASLNTQPGGWIGKSSRLQRRERVFA